MKTDFNLKEGTMGKYGQGFVAVGLVLLISGCSVRTYTQVKDRVDQNIPGSAVANAGNFQAGNQGSPSPAERKKTRRTYVVEFQTLPPIEEETNAPAPAVVPAPAPEAPPANYGYMQPPAPVVAPPVETETVEYKVEKGDTLQKISKKYYDTYRKWNKVYEANKEKIKNPNSLKVGTVLTIPDVQKGGVASSAGTQENLK